MADLTGGPLKNQRHEAFAQALYGGKSAIEAYTLAGYKPDRGAAARLSANVNIKNRVKALRQPAFDKYAVTNDRVTRELALLAFSRPQDYKRILHSGDLDDVTSEESASIRELTVERIAGKGGDDDQAPDVIRTKIRWADKHQPLVTLARMQGMLTDGPDVNIPVSFTVEFAAPPKGS